MSSILNQKIVDDAKASVDTYVAQVGQLNGQLKGIMDELKANGMFVGDGNDGFAAFYTKNVLPAVETNLTGQGGLMDSVKKMMDDIGTQLMGSVDPAIGKNNENA